MTPKVKLLIVDDFEDSADITAAYLEDGGFTDVSFARSAEEAYEILGLDGGSEPKDGDIDLVIMDIVLPRIDGIEACARIRLHPRYRSLPILMLSAVDDVDLLNEAFMAGANDFVSKPVHQVSLLARVRSLLRLRREQQRREMRETQLAQQRLDLQRGSLDSTLIDPLTRLASAQVVDLTLRTCIDRGDGACLAFLQIDEFAAFEREQGKDEADRLVRKVAGAIAATPAPLAAILVAYERGAFMVVLPRASGTRSIEKTCEFAREAVAELKIAHGSSVFTDTVTLSSAVAFAAADQLADLPSRLLADFRRGWRKGNSHVFTG